MRIKTKCVPAMQEKRKHEVIILSHQKTLTFSQPPHLPLGPGKVQKEEEERECKVTETRAPDEGRIREEEDRRAHMDVLLGRPPGV